MNGTTVNESRLLIKIYALQFKTFRNLAYIFPAEAKYRERILVTWELVRAPEIDFQVIKEKVLQSRSQTHSHLCLDLSSGNFPTGLPVINLKAILSSPILAIFTFHFNFLRLIVMPILYSKIPGPLDLTYFLRDKICTIE